MTPERDQDYLQLQRELAALQVENERLKADKERLDWLEKRKAQLTCSQGAPGNYHYQVGTWPSESSYRKAIDVVMAREAA